MIEVKGLHKSFGDLYVLKSIDPKKREVANKVVFIDEGLIVEEGSPEQFFTKATQKRTQEFLSKIL